MSVVNVIDTLAQWVEESISPNILLKLAPPPEADEAGNYDYQLVHPAVFPMYVPTQEKLPPGVHSEVPSICVRFVKGADSVTERSGTMDVQLCLSAWNPGLHGRDILIPLEDGRCKFRPLSHTCTDIQPRCHGVSATPSRSGATVVRGAVTPL